MLRGFSAELRRLFILAVVCVLVGLWFDRLSWTLLAGGALYIAWMVWQIRRLNKWLLRQNDEPPPESSGIWGELFDNIYHLQRRQVQEKNSLRAVISRVQETSSALRDGVIVLDWRGCLDWWNPSAQRLLGFHSSDQGKSVINFIRHPRFVSYFEEGNYSEPLELPSPRFSSKQLQFQITRFGRNERLIVVRDTTQLHKLEQMRQDFVANVSHELRTPLTVITGYLETLSDSGAELSPSWQKALRQMQQQSRRMSLLINDLITLSKLETTESGHNHKPVALKPLLESIRSEAQALSGEKNHQIFLECETPDLELAGNEKELHSAFSNLVTNAVKYTPAEGRIVMRLWEAHQQIFFSVNDNGPGFDSKHIPHLTQRFYRVEQSRNSGTGGTGLGLAIVKHVLMRHDGELQISSELGRGSTFTCIFSRS
ncbi:phosphate regulon sensor histidine kinase PhoR [Marinimicrobium sp. C2-29]|uniref:phosphate regulon sensor histidine kinase PhoR n=1 Tax=Marinimicrobium sp. C2-29 TaxID=3139825 RepID=UPI00313A002B